MARPELIDAARRGDHEAFQALAVAVSGRLYAVARLILRDADLAEDAVQEALVNMWRGLPTLRDPDRFDGWSYRLVVNACADAGRHRRRLSAEVRLIGPQPGHSDASAEVADRDLLERGFRHLSPDQRVALVLHYYLDLPTHRIAEILGVPVGTAKSRIHYGTQIMRAALESEPLPAVDGDRGRSA